MSGDFFDSNMILYLLDDGPKADVAETLLEKGGHISVQVLNETLVNCLRKAQMSWEETGLFLGGIRAICTVHDLSVRTHDVARALGERYGFSVYDAMIVASALLAGCDRLLTEDMHHGLVVEGQLTLHNPYK